MNDRESLSDLCYVNQTQLAERELSAFVGAVTNLFGLEQARISTEDWLEEAELVDSPRRPTANNWRAVTIAASARLASRIDAAVSSEISDKTNGHQSVANTIVWLFRFSAANRTPRSELQTARHKVGIFPIRTDGLFSHFFRLFDLHTKVSVNTFVQ